MTIRDVMYPYQNTLDDPKRDPRSPLYPEGLASFFRKNGNNVWEYYWGTTVEVTDKPGLPGQSTDNPKSTFGDHWIVRISGKYYDPSYGNPFDSVQASEDGSVAGFAVVDPQGVNNNYRLVFCKNPEGPDIKSDEQ